MMILDFLSTTYGPNKFSIEATPYLLIMGNQVLVKELLFLAS